MEIRKSRGVSISSSALKSVLTWSCVVTLVVQAPGGAVGATTPALSLRNTVSRLEYSRQQLNQVLKKAVVFNKIKNLTIKGRVSGKINGTQVEHSPLSMFLLGGIAGALAGATAGGALSLPFFAASAVGASTPITGLAGVGAVAGGVIGPAIPTGSGTIAGTLDGYLNGEGYQVLDSAQAFGLVVLDSAVAEGFRLTVDRNPDYNYAGCASTIRTYLAKLAHDPAVLNEKEMDNFMGHLSLYNAGIDELRQIKSQAVGNPAVLSQVDRFLTEYDGWIKPKRISIVSVVGLKPVYDLQKKVIVEDTCGKDAIISAPPDSVHQGIFTHGGQRVRFWAKPFGYQESQLKADFVHPEDRRIKSINRVTVLVPEGGADPDKFKRFPEFDYRYSEIVPAKDSEGNELICKGNTKKEAIEFLLRTSKSFDEFFLSNPPPALAMDYRAH